MEQDAPTPENDIPKLNPMTHSSHGHAKYSRASHGTSISTDSNPRKLIDFVEHIHQRLDL